MTVGFLWKDEIAQITDPILEALRVAIVAHGADGTPLNICVGCSREYRESGSFSRVYFPCRPLKAIAAALGVSDDDS